MGGFAVEVSGVALGRLRTVCQYRELRDATEDNAQVRRYVGRWKGRFGFSSRPHAAILMRRGRSGSNWAAAELEQFVIAACSTHSQ